MVSYQLTCGILAFLIINNANAVCVTDPVSTTTRPGGDVFLDCTCTGVDAATYDITWCLEQSCVAPLTTGPNYNINNQIIDVTTVKNTLTVISAQIDDTNTYYCQGSNTAIVQAELVIVDVPEARIMPSDASIVYGQNTTLECQLLNSNGQEVDEPVEWKKNEEDVKEDIDGDGKIDIDVSGRQLVIISADSSDGGSYSCGQYNRSLPVEDILVMQTPIMLSQNMRMAIKGGKASGTVECSAKGYPLASIKWEGKGIENFKQNTSTSILTSTEKSTLEIKEFKEADQGNYQCIASNAISSTMTDFTITVESSGCSLKPSAWTCSVFLLLYTCISYISNL